jgi:hypothetical protein
MSKGTEYPFLLAGAVNVTASFRDKGGWTPGMTKAVAATGVLAVLASVTADTPVEPLIVGVGWLFFAATASRAVLIFATKPKGK